MSVQKKQPDERDLRYLQLIAGRREGYPEDEIAGKLGFGSPEDLYQRINEDGHPICPTCGTTYVKERHCEPRKQERLPRGTDQGMAELPAVNDAAELFKESVEKLRLILGELPFIQQWLKDGRFITEGVYPKESGRFNLVYRLEDYGWNHFRWKLLCKKHGINPNVEEFKVPFDRVLAGGAAWHPHDFVVWLVTAYAITGAPLENLLGKLHPAPEAKDVEAACKKRDELLLKARQLSALMRGNTRAVKQGRKAEYVTPDEQMDFWALETYREHGWPEEELAPSLVDSSPEERDRIRDLRLPHTEQDPK